jgi:hypothetical protein
VCTLLVCQLQDESSALHNELRRQLQEAPRFEAQIAAATQRVVELEAQVSPGACTLTAHCPAKVWIATTFSDSMCGMAHPDTH